MRNYHYPLHQADLLSNFKQLLDYMAEKYAHQPAIVSQEVVGGPLREISFYSLRDDVAACCAGLRTILKLKVNQCRDHKIALMASNSYHWVLLYLSCGVLNLTTVPLDPQLPLPDLLTLLQRSGANYIAFSNEIEAKIKQIRGELSSIKGYFALGHSPFGTYDLSEVVTLGRQNKYYLQDYQDTNVFGQNICSLIFTSGTTSEPKGVMLCQKNLTSMIYGVAQIIDVRDKVFLSVLPLYHSFECSAGMLLPLYQGSTIYYLAGGVQNFAANLQLAKPTMIFLVPLLAEGSYKRLKAKFPHDSEEEFAAKLRTFFGGRLKKMIIGGAPLNPAIAAIYEKLGIQVMQGYGITENSPVAACNREQANKHAAIGLPLPNLRVKIHEPNEDGVGEVLVHGPTVMLGYFDNERLTNEVIKNGWLYTGDYGYFDDEDFLYIVGRKKNIILGKNGKNVYPEEIEFVLNNTPAISEAMVYGQLVDDDVQVAALIVPHLPTLQTLEPRLLKTPDDAQLLTQTMRQQIDKINQNMAKHKRVLQFQIVSGLPRTTTGKIKRSKIPPTKTDNLGLAAHKAPQ